MIELLDAPFDPAARLADFQEQIGDAGAVVSFTGLVRATSVRGDVIRLHLQAHPVLTRKGIVAAVEAAEARWPLTATLVLHRVGDLAPREPIVMVAAASRHRRAAFEAADSLMDYLKTEAVFWKKETTVDGADWIEPREEDYQDAARWRAEKEPA